MRPFTLPLVTTRKSVSSLAHVLLLLAISSGGANAFEQDHRINGLTVQFTTDAFATANAFGGAFVSSIGQGQLQTSISSEISSGGISLIFTMPGLGDLTGVNDPSLQIGVLNATPVLDTNNPTSYSGTSDLDWWYIPDPADLDSHGVPTAQISGSISSRTLTAGPGRLTLGGLAGGASAIWDAVFRANIGSSSAPLQSANNFPPGHRPSENLDPLLVSFSSMTNGQLKGNISAASLAAIPIPSSLANNGYTSSNSLLDVLIGGYVYLGFITLVRPTQPDQVDTNSPALGAGPPYTFTTNASKVVTGCHDRTGATVNLAAALGICGYSSYFKFTTDRVIVLTPPEIAVEQPLGTNLNNGDSRDFGYALMGASTNVTFTIINTGWQDLTNLAITIDGPDAAAFSVTVPPIAPVSGPNGSTTFTVQFAPATNGAMLAALHLANNDADENPFNINLQGTGLTALENWRLTYFGSIANSGDGADANDYDHDGIPNIVEFAFGLNPRVNSAGQLPPWQLNGGNFVNSFTQPAGVSGILYGAQWSSTLAPASWTAIPDTGTAPQHTFSVPIGANNQLFVRLVIRVQ